MVSIRETVCIRDLTAKMKNEKWKLKLVAYTRCLVFIILICLFVFSSLVSIYEDTGEGLLSNITIFLVFPSFLTIFLFIFLVLPFIKTDISSVDLIAIYLSETAMKLDESIRQRNKEEILTNLSKIKNELDLIHGFYENYRPRQIRRSKAPFVAETEDFLKNLEKVLKKISYVIKNDLELNFENLQQFLENLAEYLCKHQDKTKHKPLKGFVDDILHIVEEIPEDEDFGKSMTEAFVTNFSKIWRQNFWIRFLIPAGVFLAFYFLFLYPNYEYWAGIVVLIFLGWATASK